MKIHEHQARDLLASAGIPVPAGRTITNAAHAADAYTAVTQQAGSPLAVVKAQVHAGGRGKAGFVKLVRSPAEAADAARFMLSNRMVSPQTPPEGLEVNTLLIAAGVDIATRHQAGCKLQDPSRPAEFYLAVTTDRDTRRNILIASSEGGVDIEHVAETTPDKIVKLPLHPLMGLQPHQAAALAAGLGFTGKLARQAADVMLKLAKLFQTADCTLAEINPLVVAMTRQHDGSLQPAVIAIDAKFSFDENALFRHKDIAAFEAHEEQDAAELRAQAAGLSYIKLDGSIGCLVNGAGLAMATMDTIKHHGGEPANFLDVGGGATQEAVTEAFRIILSDHKVKGILVNIFGGIMDCRRIAGGIVNAATEIGFQVPLVVRLEGNNAQGGRQTLQEAAAKLPTLQAATDLGDAAKKIVAAVG